MKRGIIAGVAGAAALATAALFGPNAIADLHGGADAPRSPIDGPEVGTVDIGRAEPVDLVLSLPGSPAGRVRQVLHHPEAAYVAVHFAELSAPPGSRVTVSNPDGTESHRVDTAAADQWATSVTGDTAIVELRGPTDAVGADTAGLGAVIDQVAYGYSPAELAEQRRREPVTESQCGGDDKHPAACYESSHPVEYANTDPVARVLIEGTTLCTAFRVGDDNTLLTNNHCFNDSRQARNAELWFGYQCKRCKSDETTTPVKVHGQRVLSTDQNLDYTLFTVDDFGAIKSYGSLTLADRTTRPGEELYIPQHPGGRPAELAMDSDTDSGNCQVYQPRYDGYLAGSDMAYYCDTEFGSSGSPVLSRDTHEVVGLHHFGGCPNSGVRSDLLLRRIGHLL